MLDIKKLYDLQEIDLQISVLEKELVTLANNLKDKSKIELVDNNLKNLEIRISNIASQQRASERALSDIEDKLEKILDIVKEHPFLKSSPSEARRVAKFRIRLLNLK